MQEPVEVLGKAVALNCIKRANQERDILNGQKESDVYQLPRGLADPVTL